MEAITGFIWCKNRRDDGSIVVVYDWKISAMQKDQAASHWKPSELGDDRRTCRAALSAGAQRPLVTPVHTKDGGVRGGRIASLAVHSSSSLIDPPVFIHESH